MNGKKTGSQVKIDGVVVGLLTSISGAGDPLVAYVGNISELPAVAKSTVAVDTDAIGREVALLFEDGDITKPIIMGLMYKPDFDKTKQTEVLKLPVKDVAVEKWTPSEESNELLVDGKRMQLNAKEKIVLKCGKSSITMTQAGKVIIRGTYISTRSSGANRIKGGSVQIN